MDQERRERNKQVLDRIASDPKFREELLDDPKGAMERAGLKWEGDDDVTGYILLNPLPTPPEPASGGGLTAPPGGGGGTSGLLTAVCDPTEEKKQPPAPGKGGLIATPPD